MTIRRKIKKIIDGDTFETVRKLKGTNFIRIRGKNAPEKGQKGYAISKKKLSRLSGKVVTLVPKARDKYGRIVAEVRYKRKKVR